MKINLTKKQYKALIKLLYLGTWVANSHRTYDTIEEFEDLEQYILSFSKDFGVEHAVVYDESIGKFFLEGEFIGESGIDELIDEYDDDTFWQELIFRLAERDMEERYGEDALNKMDLEEWIIKRSPFLRIYEDEFYENGLSNLRLIKGLDITH